MPLYPVLNPVPDNINNPLILTLPPSTSTATGLPMDTPLLENILFPVLSIGVGSGVVVSTTHLRCFDGVLGWYDNGVGAAATLSEPTRNSFREALTVDLAGAAQAASPCCIAYQGGPGGMPGYSEENSWAIFTTCDNGENAQTNMTAGLFSGLGTHYAWLFQHFDHAWKSAIAAGVIPSGSAYIVRSTTDGELTSPYGYAECYGFDTVDDVASIAIAANWLWAFLHPTLANIEIYDP